MIDENSVQQEYERRRKKQLWGNALPVITILVIVISGFLGARLNIGSSWFGLLIGIGLLFFVAMSFVKFILWFDWRCPACDQMFSGFAFNQTQVSPLAGSPLFCPHCGVKLR